MVTRVHFCARCQRPIRTNREYCSDCEALLSSPIMSTPRCSSCSRTAQIAGPLYWNPKIQKIYCTGCFSIFRTELEKKGFKDSEISHIMKKDFYPLNRT